MSNFQVKTSFCRMHNLIVLRSSLPIKRQTQYPPASLPVALGATGTATSHTIYVGNLLATAKGRDPIIRGGLACQVRRMPELYLDSTIMSLPH